MKSTSDKRGKPLTTKTSGNFSQELTICKDQNPQSKARSKAVTMNKELGSNKPIELKSQKVTKPSKK